MFKNYLLSAVLIFFLAPKLGLAQETILYKKIDTTSLFVEIHQPSQMDDSRQYPAMVFFFGGGWNGGTRHHFLPQAKYFANRGLVCFLVDYRTRKKHGTTPFECVKDAKSAIRFIRANAAQFQIDPNQVIAAGGSAGGHLAAATALIEAYNEDTDDRSVSCIPNALVLFNPVSDNGPGGYGFERIGTAYQQFSPLHNIHKGAPPTLFLLGTEDNLIPVEMATYYKMVMEKVGSRCDLVLYEGQEHGFFNKSEKRGAHYFNLTVLEADRFLQSLGYLEGEASLGNE